MCVKFHDSRNIPSEAAGGGIFDYFRDNFRPEVDTDVIGMVERVKFWIQGQTVLEIFERLILSRKNE